MRNTFESRRITRALVVAAIAGAALTLTACQTAAQSAPAPVVAPQSDPVVQEPGDEVAGRSADRIAEEIDRRVRAGQLPSSACRRHVVVEQPDGEYHLVCTVPAGQ